MKKFLLFVLMFANYSAFATDPDIAASETTLACDSDVLNSDNGPVDIEINWEPNTLQLRWYNGNTLIENIPNESQSCVYDDGLVPPSTIPTRTGYTFTGWRARPMMDFSTIPTNVAGIEFWSKSRDNALDRCYHGLRGESPDVLECTKDPNFSDLQQYEWKASFDNGMVYGMAKCSSDSGTEKQPENPSDTNGKYCWCKVTGYRPTGQTTLYGPSLNMHWIYIDAHASDTTTCNAYFCVRRCAKYLINNRLYLQQALFSGS